MLLPFPKRARPASRWPDALRTSVQLHLNCRSFLLEQAVGIARTAAAGKKESVSLSLFLEVNNLEGG